MMKYEKGFLRREGFLVSKKSIPTAQGRAFSYGVYDKSSFGSLEDFARFAQNISSLSRSWYQSGDLDKSYDYYFPDDLAEGCWIDPLTPKVGNMGDGILSLGDTEISKWEISSWEGTFYLIGDSREFALAGETTDFYIDAFLADSVMVREDLEKDFAYRAGMIAGQLTGCLIKFWWLVIAVIIGIIFWWVRS